MLRATPRITIDDDELREDFVRSSGPGGQNVNKVATAVQLRFDAAHSPNLPEDVRKRLIRLAGRRMTDDGELIIEAKRYRSLERNRRDARDRLAELILRAASPPKRRRKTRPTLASKKRRVESKKRRGQIKSLRQPPQTP